MRGVTGQKRNVCSKFAPHSLFSLSVQFSLCSSNAGEMDAPLRPAFFTCAERKSQYFVTACWLHYHTNAAKSRGCLWRGLRGVLCGVRIVASNFGPYKVKIQSGLPSPNIAY